MQVKYDYMVDIKYLLKTEIHSSLPQPSSYRSSPIPLQHTECVYVCG